MLLWHIDFELKATEKSPMQEGLSALPPFSLKAGQKSPERRMSSWYHEEENVLITRDGELITK